MILQWIEDAVTKEQEQMCHFYSHTTSTVCHMTKIERHMGWHRVSHDN